MIPEWLIIVLAICVAILCIVYSVGLGMAIYSDLKDNHKGDNS